MPQPGSPRVQIDKDAAPAENATGGSTPSERLTQQAVKAEVLTAAGGMKIKVRQPDVLAAYDLVEAVGAEAAENSTYMQMINPLIYVDDIDGDRVFMPSSKGEVRVLIKRLGHEGMAAVNAWYITNVIAPTMDALEAAKQQDRVKN